MLQDGRGHLERRPSPEKGQGVADHAARRVLVATGRYQRHSSIRPKADPTAPRMARLKIAEAGCLSIKFRC